MQKPQPQDLETIKHKLQEKEVKTTLPRLIIGYYCLNSHQHPTAYQIEEMVSKHYPEISLASIYNTLNLFVEKGLLREVHVEKDQVRYDPMLEPHHHFYDTRTKKIYDIEWDQIQISQNKKLDKKFKVHQSQVLMKGVITQ